MDNLPYELDTVLYEANTSTTADNVISYAKIEYLHMIKYLLQPEAQSTDWVSKIANSSDNMRKLLTPVVSNCIKDDKQKQKKLNKAFEDAINKAHDETHKDTKWLKEKSEGIKALTPNDLADFDKTIKFLKDNYNNKSDNAESVKNLIDDYIKGEK